jgi:hypothetical protein
VYDKELDKHSLKKKIMKHTLTFLLFSIFLIPGLSLADSTDGCHCFRDRSYDPANKFSADGYLLTTTYNSLIAAVFDISKGQIIMKKMKGGVNGNDLLIGLYISIKTKQPLDLLLSIRDNGGSWGKIMTAPGMQAKIPADSVLSAINAGENTATIVRMITDNMLRTYYSIPDKRVQQIRSYSLDDKETSLLFALHRQTGTSPKQLVEMFKRQKMSWSEIAHHYRLTPAKVGKNLLENK